MSKKAISVQIPIVPINSILIPKNIRHSGWERNIDELMQSIEHHGLEQPPKVRLLSEPGPNGEQYELVYGQRRLEACKRLGWTTIPVIFARTKASMKDIFVSRLVENCDREDLSPLEEAEIFRQAIDQYGLTAKELARRIGKTDGYVSQRLKLLNLPDKVKEAVQKGEISPTHARELTRITDQTVQEKLLNSAKKLPIAEFKTKVDNIDTSVRKITNRGRRSKKTNQLTRPSREKIQAAIEEVGIRQKTAEKNNDTVTAEYYKGMLRGIEWVCGFVEKLF